MGGKGQKRREKNYKAAHGGYARLPPPPKLGDADVLPSKLRHLMKFFNRPPPNKPESAGGAERGEKKGSSGGERKSKPKDVLVVTDSEFKMDDKNDKTKSAEHKEWKEGNGATTNTSSQIKEKKKRKRKFANDLRFQDLDPATTSSRKQKRKEYSEAKKKKHKKASTGDMLEFPKHEEIRFGERVEAPPKLSFPKALKKVHDASLERRRLQAVEAYRGRKGWESRPGIHLPPMTTGNQSS